MSWGAFGMFYVPVAVWLATALGLWLAFRRSASPLLLRLAASFLALWALLATTVLVWVVTNGGWTGVLRLASAPEDIFRPASWGSWLVGGVGAFAVLAGAFALNQSVGRGFLRLLRPHPIPWPTGVERPRERTSLLAFDQDRPAAFSFTLLELSRSPRLGFRRHEVILLSRGLLERLEPDEREAAIAHEVGHVQDLDGRYLTFVRTFSRLMRWDPVLAFVSAELTRREEYRADARAAELTRRPLALARALYKVSLVDPAGDAPLGAAAFLGCGGARGRREVLDRIERLLALSESGRYSEERRAFR